MFFNIRTLIYLNFCILGISRVLTRSSNPPIYDGDGNKLLMSFVIFHHGESSPAKPLVYPTFDFNFRLWPNGTDHLTGWGKRQMETLGKSIRRYYELISFPDPAPAIDINQLSRDLLERMIKEPGKASEISNSLKKRDLSAETDKYHFRTPKLTNYIQGAHHFARGFFQPPQSPYPTGPPPPPNYYTDSIKYSYNDTYATIAPQTVVPTNDYLLYGGLACAKFNAKVREIMTASTEAHYINQEFQKLFHDVSNGSGIRDMSMMYIPVLVDPLIMVRDVRAKYMAALEAREPGVDESLKAHFDSLFPPKWMSESNFESLVKIYQHLWYQLVYRETDQIKLGVGQLLNRMIDLMLGGIGKVKTLIFEGGNEFKAIANPLPDMHFFVVPRHTHMALKKALRQDYKKGRVATSKVQDVKKRVEKIMAGKMSKIKYGETVIVELVQLDEKIEADAGKRYVVRFYEKASWDPLDIIKPLKAGKCSTSCPLRSFYSQIKDILPTQINKECAE